MDTSILIDYLRRPGKVNLPLEELTQLYPKERLAISMLSVQELYSGKSSRESVKEKLFLELVEVLEILPYSYSVAKLAGEITRDFGKSIGFPDAAIAATAILNKASLFTLNKKDFQGINKLKLV